MTEQNTLNHVLAKSYLAHFVASIVGLLVDAFIAVPFDVPYAHTIAIIFFGLGPMIILWAQYTSWHCEQHKHSATFYMHGPYRFVRNPTHLGVLILVAGYTMVAGSFVFFGTTLLGFLISNIFFKKYEAINHQSFGEHYAKYKAQTPRL
jgi:protein-S-isoprenylcysteine O-methyltransferase Ste14